MVELYSGGAYLLNGTELIPDDQQAAAAIQSKTGKEISGERYNGFSGHRVSTFLQI